MLRGPVFQRVVSVLCYRDLEKNLEMELGKSAGLFAHVWTLCGGEFLILSRRFIHLAATPQTPEVFIERPLIYPSISLNHGSRVISFVVH